VTLRKESKYITVFEEHGIGVTEIAFAAVNNGLLIEIFKLIRCALRHNGEIYLLY
jgi:hypothetical protein